MAGGTVHCVGEGVAQKHSPPWAGARNSEPGGLPVGKGLGAVQWVWEREEQQGQISRLPASLAPAGPRHPARSLTQPWSMPPVSMGFRVENVDPSALPCTWLGVAGPRFPGPDCPRPIQPAEPAASDGPVSVTRRPRSAFAATWAPTTANTPITPTGCVPGPPRPAKGALCLPPKASGGLAPKALPPENSFPRSPSFPERPQTQPWTVPGLPGHSALKKSHTGGGAWDTQKILQPIPWAIRPSSEYVNNVCPGF